MTDSFPQQAMPSQNDSDPVPLPWEPGEGRSTPIPQDNSGNSQPTPPAQPAGPPGKVIVIPGLEALTGPRQQEVPAEISNSDPKILSAVKRHLYEGSQKEVYKTRVALSDLEKLKEKLNDDQLNEKVSDAFAKAEEEYAAEHSDIARSTRKQLIELVTSFEKRLKGAQNPEREMIVIESELYEMDKAMAKMDAMLTSRLKLEYTLYPVTRGHSDIIPNEAADRAMNDVMALRALGYDEAANQYHLDLLQHKAVRSEEDERKMHELKHLRPGPDGSNKNSQSLVSMPQEVDSADLGAITVTPLVAEARRAVPPGVASLISA